MQIDNFLIFEIRSKIVSKDNFDGFILKQLSYFCSTFFVILFKTITNLDTERVKIF